MVGVVGAAVAGSFRFVDQMAAPVVAALAVIPIVALAPVLYSMFGAAVNTGRIIVAGVSVAVPVYLNTLRGIRQVRAVHRDLMTAYAAGPLQVIRAVTLPTATPYVFTGLRVASSLAVIAALIAEYFGGPIGGLGKSITSSAASSNYPLAWAYVLGVDRPRPAVLRRHPARRAVVLTPPQARMKSQGSRASAQKQGEAHEEKPEAGRGDRRAGTGHDRLR